MIYHCKVSISDIQTQQKEYPWPSPPCCPSCKGRLWGHGFVTRRFNQIKGFLFVKRWICSRCKKVITARPELYWRRFQESITRIFEALHCRILGGRWPPWCPRQRGGHWLKKFNLHAASYILNKGSAAETINFYKEKNLVIF